MVLEASFERLEGCVPDALSLDTELRLTQERFRARFVASPEAMAAANAMADRAAKRHRNAIRIDGARRLEHAEAGWPRRLIVRRHWRPSLPTSTDIAFV